MANVAENKDEQEFQRGTLPCPDPLESSVNAGVFGYDEQGLVVPDADDVRAMTEEHARELRVILSELDHVNRCARHGIDPVSGKLPRGEERREALTKRLQSQAAQFAEYYEDALAAYADGFGWEAAAALDRFVRENCDQPSPEPPLVQRNLF